MGKIYETDEDIVKMVEDQFAKTGLESYGLNLRVMSLTKAKDMIKVSKASAATEFIAQKEDMVQVFIYEDAFALMDEKSQLLLIEMALSAVSFDSEKEKINIESNPFVPLFNMRKKYGEVAVTVLEASYLAIKQLEDSKKNNTIAQDITPEEAGITRKE